MVPTVLFRAFGPAHGSGRFQPHHRTGYGACTVDSSSFFPSTQPGQALQLAKRPSSQAVRRGPGLSIKGHRQAIHVHVRPRKPGPPPSCGRACSLQVQQRARPCGYQAGPRGREELRRQKQGCDLASDPRRCPPRPARCFCPRHDANASGLTRPDPTHGRGVVGLAQLRCRARASYHQLKIRNHLWTCTAQGASLRPRQKFGADW
jgi:hypothetical protein